MAEVAAYIREKGYTFSAEHFWHYNDNKGWRIGRNVMKSWRSACETWQAKENRDAARQAHIDAKVDERESRRRIAEGERMNEAAQLQRAKMLGNAVATLGTMGSDPLPCRWSVRGSHGSAVWRLDFDCTSGDCFINRQNIFHQPMKIFLSTDENLFVNR